MSPYTKTFLTQKLLISNFQAPKKEKKGGSRYRCLKKWGNCKEEMQQAVIVEVY